MGFRTLEVGVAFSLSDSRSTCLTGEIASYFLGASTEFSLSGRMLSLNSGCDMAINSIWLFCNFVSAEISDLRFLELGSFDFISFPKFSMEFSFSEKLSVSKWRGEMESINSWEMVGFRPLWLLVIIMLPET
uniref:Uncharacterized protein n=1 Tax=Arundo donax TaxID=35708 RepID=A0A0A9CET7_ARUDO